MGLNVTRQDTPSSPIRRASLLQSAANISDMMVRTKYKLFGTPWALGVAQGAAGVRVRIPSGNPNEGLGTGYGEIGPYFAAFDEPARRLVRLVPGRRRRCRHRQHPLRLGAL